MVAGSYRRGYFLPLFAAVQNCTLDAKIKLAAELEAAAVVRRVVIFRAYGQRSSPSNCADRSRGALAVSLT